jgi:hypothetical protein
MVVVSLIYQNWLLKTGTESRGKVECPREMVLSASTYDVLLLHWEGWQQENKDQVGTFPMIYMLAHHCLDSGKMITG